VPSMTVSRVREDRVPDIKARISIPMVAERFFSGWQPKVSCKSPFREEDRPSFSVYANGTKWKDQATGNGGSVIDFYMQCKSCDRAQAIADLKGWLDGGTVNVAPIIRAPAAPKVEERKPQVHPELRKPTVAELEEISEWRSISVPALQIAVDRGFLWTATSTNFGYECLIVTDQTRKNYRVRRMDRQLINGSKAICLTGSQASWPIGLEDAKSYPCIALCEGEMDFLAAFGHAYASGVEDQVAPVCMSGASNRIPEEVIPLFKDKRVRIFVQADKAGEDASMRWYKQLKGVSTKVDGFDFASYYDTNESVVTDLNDLLRVHSDCWEQHREDIESIMNF
jgi:hypothetical protein